MFENIKRGKAGGMLVEKFLTTAIDLESMSIAYHDMEVAGYRYDSTPKDALIFASSGVDGCHYCAVPNQGRSIDESPVYYVSPMDFEGTVVWVAKNFIDFLSIGAAMGSFTFISSCPFVNKEKFENLVEESWNENCKEEKMKAIKQLEEHFPLIRYKDVFKHIKESYADINNHVSLDFGGLNVKIPQLGLYNVQ